MDCLLESFLTLSDPDVSTNLSLKLVMELGLSEFEMFVLSRVSIEFEVVKIQIVMKCMLFEFAKQSIGTYDAKCQSDCSFQAIMLDIWATNIDHSFLICIGLSDLQSRIGVMMKTILPALGQAVVLNSNSSAHHTGSFESLKSQLQFIQKSVTSINLFHHYSGCVIHAERTEAQDESEMY